MFTPSRLRDKANVEKHDVLTGFEGELGKSECRETFRAAQT